MRNAETWAIVAIAFARGAWLGLLRLIIMREQR